MTEPADLATYYARRAAEYENIYAKPERQEELAWLKQALPHWFEERSTLEVACGTGYWTQFLAMKTPSILAIDLNEEVLAIARQKTYGRCDVQLQRADAFTMLEVPDGFAGAFVGFWWSHIPKGRRPEFLTALHSKLQPGAIVVLLDNLYVPGSNSPMADTTDAEGNTYSLRRLADGTEWKVLKNFPSEAELRQDLASATQNVEYGRMKYYWWIKYHPARPSAPHC